MIRALSLLVITMVSVQVAFSQEGRLENEYKLNVPITKVAEVWAHLVSEYNQPSFKVAEVELQGTVSEEDFIDRYFDTHDGILLSEEISLRHRKRFKDGQLLKELIQFKKPYSEDKVIRTEIKFKAAKADKDKRKRHPFLKFLPGSEKERMAYNLAKYGVVPEEIDLALKLTQNRRRVYLKDSKGESMLTMTLDEVKSAGFPYQKFVELELELNEVRYTQAGPEEKRIMETLNEGIKERLFSNFPFLEVDQRSKFLRMTELNDSNPWSARKSYLIWSAYGLIVCVAGGLFIKEMLV